MTPATDSRQREQRALSPVLDGEVREWLLAMQGCVRACDFGRARELFSPQVFSFGSAAPVADGLERLEEDQWRAVWSRTRGFRFDLQEARAVLQGETACVAVPWRSLGVRPDGSTFERRGRATLVLVRSGGELVAVHSHFSMWPREDT